MALVAKLRKKRVLRTYVVIENLKNVVRGFQLPVFLMLRNPHVDLKSVTASKSDRPLIYRREKCRILHEGIDRLAIIQFPLVVIFEGDRLDMTNLFDDAGCQFHGGFVKYEPLRLCPGYHKFGHRSASGCENVNSLLKQWAQNLLQALTHRPVFPEFPRGEIYLDSLGGSFAHYGEHCAVVLVFDCRRLPAAQLHKKGDQAAAALRRTRAMRRSRRQKRPRSGSG